VREKSTEREPNLDLEDFSDSLCRALELHCIKARERARNLSRTNFTLPKLGSVIFGEPVPNIPCSNEHYRGVLPGGASTKKEVTIEGIEMVNTLVAVGTGRKSFFGTKEEAHSLC